MVLTHGNVYPKDNPWMVEHRTWLSRQQLREPLSDLAFADPLPGGGVVVRQTAIVGGPQSSPPTSSGGRHSAGCERSAGSRP